MITMDKKDFLFLEKSHFFCYHEKGIATPVQQSGGIYPAFFYGNLQHNLS